MQNRPTKICFASLMVVNMLMTTHNIAVCNTGKKFNNKDPQIIKRNRLFSLIYRFNWRLTVFDTNLKSRLLQLFVTDSLIAK